MPLGSRPPAHWQKSFASLSETPVTGVDALPDDKSQQCHACVVLGNWSSFVDCRMHCRVPWLHESQLHGVA